MRQQRHLQGNDVGQRARHRQRPRMRHKDSTGCSSLANTLVTRRLLSALPKSILWQSIPELSSKGGVDLRRSMSFGVDSFEGPLLEVLT